MEGIFVWMGYPELTHQAWLPVVAICSHHRIPQSSQGNLLWRANSKPSPLFRPGINTFLLWWLILGELPSLTVFWDVSLHSLSASTFYLRTFVRSSILRENRWIAHISYWKWECIYVGRRKRVVQGSAGYVGEREEGKEKKKLCKGERQGVREGKKEGREGRHQL